MKPDTWHLGVLAVVANAYGVSQESILSDTRKKRPTLARHICWYIHDADGRTQSEIGRTYGDRDHSTVAHGLARIAKLRQSDPDLEARLRSLLAACVDIRPVPQVYEITIPPGSTVNIQGLTKV